MTKELETSEVTEAKPINATSIEAVKPVVSDVTVNNSVELADVITAIEKTSTKELGVLASIEKSLSRKALDVESAAIHKPSIPVQNLDSVKPSKTIVATEQSAVAKNSIQKTESISAEASKLISKIEKSQASNEISRSNEETVNVIAQSQSKSVSDSKVNAVEKKISTITENAVSTSTTNNKDKSQVIKQSANESVASNSVKETKQTSISEAVNSKSIASSKTDNSSTIESIVKGDDGRYRNENGSFASKAQIKEFEKLNKPDSEDKDKIADLENKSLLVKIKDSIIDSAKSDDGESLIGKSVFGSVYDIAQEAKGLYSETVDLKEKTVEVLTKNSQSDSDKKIESEESQVTNSKDVATGTSSGANEIKSTDTQASSSAEAIKGVSTNVSNTEDNKSSNARYTEINTINSEPLKTNVSNDLNTVSVDIKSVNEQLLTESKDHTASLRGILESTKFSGTNNSNMSVSDKLKSFFTKDKNSEVNNEQLNTETNENVKKETNQDSSKFSIQSIKEKAFASVSSRVQSVKDKYSDVKTKLTPFNGASNDEAKDKKTSFIDQAKEKISSYFKSDSSTVNSSTNNNQVSDNKTESISANKQVEKQSKSAVKGNTQNTGNVEDQILAEIQGQSDVLSDILDETKANSGGAGGGSIIDDLLGAGGGDSKGGKGKKGAKKQGRFSKTIDKLKSKSPRFAKVANAGGNVAAKVSGAGAKAASLVSSAGSGALKVVSKVAAPLTAVLAGYSKHQELKSDDSLTDTQKNTITGATGGGALAGAMGGAAAGAAIGSVVPLVGTAIGGLIGGALGAWFGAEGGTVVGEMVASQLDSPEDIAASQNTDKTKETQSLSEKHNAITANNAELVEIKQTEKASSTTNAIESNIASTQAPISAISQPAASPVQSIDAMKVKQNQSSKQQVNKNTSTSKNAVSNKDTSDTKLIKAINNLTKKVTAQDKNPSAVRPNVPSTFDDTHLKMISLDLE
ncbi:hypothetical protein KO527_05440 [Pseudoalteromonas sp. C2R02]|uniref:hypothetical protein n=1 Tax=Pseudoalteromonas sp. C2R02 TaxID=2841565 RepID=UPI001C08F9EF|nr:hypothetical protein [Pseudoalteromonas sp. C2R02]MBU2968792.1 hypothetical protein [Pseudoalteromonas sp. C2R02]